MVAHLALPAEADAGAPVAVLDPPGLRDPAPAASPDERRVTATLLEDLRTELRAARVALIRFEHATSSFHVAASTGRPFLATGVRLPIAASAMVVAASEGRRVVCCPESSSRPLDRLAASLGLRCGLALPLTVANTVIGGVTALWESDAPPVADPYAVVAGREAELLRPLLSAQRAARRVLVCHEDRLRATGLARVAERRLRASASVAGTVQAAIAALTVAPPDLIVCSDHLSTGERLPDIARRLRAAGAAAPLLVLARTDNGDSYEAALLAGATGYLPLATAAERLADAAQALLDGRTALAPPAASAAGPRLTARENDVLQGFEQGLSDKEIARELGVAVSTVKTHARAIYGKLDATSRTAALHKARLAGLV